jgi:hypothetical protein
LQRKKHRWIDVSGTSERKGNLVDGRGIDGRGIDGRGIDGRGIDGRGIELARKG